jgi:hypothetical protein
MNAQIRMMLTIVPSVTLAGFLMLQGWIQFPVSNRVRLFSGALSIYFIWLWVDWAVNRGVLWEIEKAGEWERNSKVSLRMGRDK